MLSILVFLGYQPDVMTEDNAENVEKELSQSAPSSQFLQGKELFIRNCAQCHAKDMITPLIAPALADTEERWATYPREDLYRWIRNSQTMITEGHPRALELWQEWTPLVMPNFSNLGDEEIVQLLIYIKKQTPE